MTTNDPDILVHAQVALEEDNKAANNSCIRITGRHKKLEFLLMGLEARSIMGGQPPAKEKDDKTRPQTQLGTEATGGEADRDKRSGERQP